METFEFYSADELTSIVHRSARLLGIPIEDAGAEEIGRRARGTPRIANRLLRRMRDFADVRADGRITRELAEYAMGRLEVDPLGLDAGDRKLLSTVIKRFDGGPVGIDSLAASLAEDRDTLEYVYEPYLIQEGFLIRTPRGRQVTRLAYEHLGLPCRARPGQGRATCSNLPVAHSRSYEPAWPKAARSRSAGRRCARDRACARRSSPRPR